MQTKKRAKPVKFGKSKTASHPVEKELDVKEIAEADINSDEVKEIKKLIEEKTHVRDEESVKEEVKKQDLDEEEREEEPLEVHLSEESTEEEQKDEEDEDDREEESEDKEEKEPARNASQGNSEREVADKEEEKEMDKQEADDPEEESSSAKATADKEEKESAEEKFTKYGSFTREEVLAPKKKSSFGFFIFVALIAFAVGLAIIAGGSYFLSGFDTKKLTDIKLPVLSEPTATPTAEPSVT
ncbi:MAG TPA: hypothetical protein VLF20_06325, partial [Patescibacteria group bacterium]|nr:hypothetical protein [Patescibacteria group bacterium]